MAASLINSCKTKQTPSNGSANKSSAQQQQATVYPTEPGTCIIQGYAINIYPPDASADEPCRSFSCRAKVVVTQCRSCGYGVPKKPVEGDTLDIKFIHTLASSEEFKKIYPAKVILPGLKKDELFEAQLKIKLAPGDKLLYDITTYELMR